MTHIALAQSPFAVHAVPGGPGWQNLLVHVILVQTSFALQPVPTGQVPVPTALQLALQVPQARALPSSQTSPASTIPFPHTGAAHVPHCIPTHRPDVGGFVRSQVPVQSTSATHEVPTGHVFAPMAPTVPQIGLHVPQLSVLPSSQTSQFGNP